MIALVTILVVNLVLGAVADWSLRRAGGLAPSQPRWLTIPFLPLAMMSVAAQVLIRNSDRQWHKRFAPERFARFIDRSRRSRYKLMDNARWKEREAQRQERRNEELRAEIAVEAERRAHGILNDRWLEATAAAREAMSAVFCRKDPLLADRDERDHHPHQVPG